MRKVLPYLSQGLLLCLGGFAFYFLWRRLSSLSLESFSEEFEEKWSEVKSWQRTHESELASQYDRIRSIAGRVDRAKRKDSNSPEASEESSLSDAPGLDDQSKLNALLAKRFHGSQAG